MKTLQRYLLRQVVASLLLTVAVFTFVLLLGNALREILPLLMNQQVTFGLVARAFGLLIPFVLVFALPIGMLTATLLVFGRFSSDQELTAARASGISLLSLITPILLLSLALCGVSATINLHIAPRCRATYNDLRSDIRAVLANLRIPANRYITEIPGFILYTERNRDNDLQNVLVYDLTRQWTYRAPRGRVDFNATNQALTLELFDAEVFAASGVLTSAGALRITLDLSKDPAGARKPDISNMSFFELRGELRDLEHRINEPLPVTNPAAEESKASSREKARALTDLTAPIRIQMHRQVAFSFACFAFTLIGIPLGIRVHRRETNIGIVMALVLMSIYYGLLIVGQSLSDRPEFAPHLWMWLPNFVFQAVGAVLLWRANRGV